MGSVRNAFPFGSHFETQNEPKITFDFMPIVGMRFRVTVKRLGYETSNDQPDAPQSSKSTLGEDDK